MKLTYFLAFLCALPLGLRGQVLNPAANARISYSAVDKQFSVVGLLPPVTAAGARNDGRWSYFWEFGDGHYSTAPSPKYCYASPGPRTVRLSVVPHYSHARTETIVQDVLTVGSCADAGCSGLGGCDGPDYSLRKLVHIETNAHEELVPGNEIQIALHYALPPGATSTRGDLFLFYNGDAIAERLGFSPLAVDVHDARRHRLFDAEPLPNAKATIREEGSNYAFARGLLDNGGYSVLGYRTRLTAGTDGRLFVTLRASESLDSTVLVGRRAALVTELKAVWVPAAELFSEATMTDNYQLRLLSVHDPNRLRIHRPRGGATYVRRAPETFEVEVEFQNLGGKAASQVLVEVPWPANLDANSIAVTDRNPGPADCPDCPRGPPAGSPASCFELDTSSVATERKLRFRFHNVMLHGRRESGVGGSKYTKGYLRFTARSNHERVQRTPLRASIRFDQDEIFHTATRAKRWRHRGFGLRAGYNFAGGPAGYERLNEDFRHWYTVGAYFRPSALISGWTPFAGVELSLSGQAFRAETARGVDDDFRDDRVGVVARETVSLQSLDLQVTTEARFGGKLALTAGIGPSLPLWAEGRILTNVVNEGYLDELEYAEYFFADNPPPLPPDIFAELIGPLDGAFERFTEVSAFGLLDPRSEVRYFDQDISSTWGLGALLSFSAEAGLLNNVAVGLRQNFRLYPGSYRGRCLKINHLEAYLRVNLVSGK